MPDPEKMLRLLDKAVAVCRKTPGRTGRLVSLTNAVDVLIAGDLHGHVGHFQVIFQKADLAENPRRHLVLQEVIHGPFLYDDGSDKSHQLLDLIAAAMVQFPGRVHFLPGNHELAQRTDRQVARASGELNSLFHAGVVTAYGDRADDVYHWYVTLIDTTPLAVRTPNRVFMSHSLPPLGKMWNPEVLSAPVLPAEEFLPGGSVYHLVWGRDVSEQAAAAFLKSVDADLLITGHIPCTNGFLVPNNRQVVLDSQQAPAGYCLFPADRPLNHSELAACITTI
jgi:Calcineurin-like phosphoesterase